jgi:hypothetical protein
MGKLRTLKEKQQQADEQNREERHIQPAQRKQMEMTERARYIQQNEAKTKTRKGWHQ